MIGAVVSVVNGLLYLCEVISEWVDKTLKNDDIDAVTQNKSASHLLSMENFGIYFSLHVLQKPLIILSLVCTEVKQPRISVEKVC